jgi:hypothetical protein
MPAEKSPILFQSGTVSPGKPSGSGWGIDPGGGALGIEDVDLPGAEESNMKP